MKALLASTLLAACIAAPAAAASSPADSTALARSGAVRADVMESPPVPHLFTRTDLYFVGAATAGVWVAVNNDQWLTSQAIEHQHSETRRKLADFFRPLPTVAVASAAGLYAYGRWFGHPILARRSGRAGVSMLVAGAVTAGLKEAFGRWRPEESPDDPFRFDPFSGHRSFPSGHATIAFAAAVALHRETTSRWVPWVAYPAASMVAWSRVHDLEHWTSDVVAGAAIGSWTAWKTESFLAGRSLGVPNERKTAFLLVPRDGTMALVITRKL